MKLAGVLAILFAIAVGGWSTVDYFQNQSARQRNIAAMQREVSRELNGGTPRDEPFDRDRDLHYWQVFDEVAFVVAGCALIVGIELIWYDRRKARTSRASAARAATIAERR